MLWRNKKVEPSKEDGTCKWARGCRVNSVLRVGPGDKGRPVQRLGGSEGRSQYRGQESSGQRRAGAKAGCVHRQQGERRAEEAAVSRRWKARQGRCGFGKDSGNRRAPAGF